RPQKPEPKWQVVKGKKIKKGKNQDKTAMQASTDCTKGFHPSFSRAKLCPARTHTLCTTCFASPCPHCTERRPEHSNAAPLRETTDESLAISSEIESWPRSSQR